jgi:hypothetical protein
MPCAAVPAAREPVEQHDDSRDEGNAAKHHKCGGHRLSPFNASVNAISSSQITMPATATPDEKTSGPITCPNTSAPTARFARSPNFSARMSRRFFVKRSIVRSPHSCLGPATTVPLTLPQASRGSAAPGPQFLQRPLACWMARTVARSDKLAHVMMHSLTRRFRRNSRHVLADFFDASVVATVCTAFSPLRRALGAFPATIGRLHVRTEGQIYRFGPFELDSCRRRLTRGRDQAWLPDRQMDVLVRLVESAGRIVSKNAPVENAWQGLAGPTSCGAARSPSCRSPGCARARIRPCCSSPT